MQVFSLGSAALILSLYVLYYAYWQMTVGAVRRRLSATRGCKPIRKFRAWDPLFSLDHVYKDYRARQRKAILETYYRLFEEAGTQTMAFNLLGQNIIISNEPENLKSIQSLDFHNWSLGEDRKKNMTPFLGEGIFTTDGEAWQHSRDMLRPNFVKSQFSDLAKFEPHFVNLLESIRKVPAGETIDLQGLFFHLSLDISTEFLFGESTFSLDPNASPAESLRFDEAFNYCLKSMEEIFLVLKRLIFGDKKFQQEMKYVHDFVDRYVEKGLEWQRRAKPSNGTASHTSSPNDSGPRYIFLRELVGRTEDKVRIRSELLNILLAGRDTTASLLSNMLFELSKRPEILARLQAEIAGAGLLEPTASDSQFPLPTYDQIKEMKYLRAFINESQRLQPVVPTNSRQAIADTVLPLGGGRDGKSPLFVPKGSFVGWLTYIMHRRKDFYGKDALEFKPERWLDDPATGQKGLRPGWEYLPFNGGPRVCIGQQFALSEVSYITVRLLQEFQTIDSRDPLPWREKLTLTCTGVGCKVALMPRAKPRPNDVSV